MANIISFEDNIVNADEIVWLDAFQAEYSAIPGDNEYKIAYFLKGNFKEFNVSFGTDKSSRDKKYLEIKSIMENHS